MTPIERWLGSKPDVSNFKVFGCDVYVHVPVEMRKKLDGKAVKGIFIGYPANRKGYKILDPVTNVQES